jgi:hypothetical protein
MEEFYIPQIGEIKELDNNKIILKILLENQNKTIRELNN